MSTVIRPAWRGSEDELALIEEINKAIDHRDQVSRAADDAIWTAVQKARRAGVPDTTIIRRTGLNRATLNRRLGARPNDKAAEADGG